MTNRRKVWSNVYRGMYLYEVGKEQDVGGDCPHVSPWGIPRLPHIIDIPCCYSSAVPSSASPRFDRSSTVLSSRRLCILCFLSLSFSHHSHRILSISIISTALRRSFRSAHQHRISTGVCPPRGRTILFLFC